MSLPTQINKYGGIVVTDNELRAHGLAVAIAAASITSPLSCAFSTTDKCGNAVIDVYAVYKAAYKEMIASFDTDKDFLEK